jgi:outer membrane immunogenic protein
MRVSTFLLAIVWMSAVPGGHAQAVPFNFEDHDLTVSKSHPSALSVGYSAMISNAPPRECGCFLLNGGSSEALVHVWKNVAAVVQLTGDHTGNVPQSQQALGLVTYMAGPRYSFLMPRRVTAYGQFLAGGMHGFDAYFPRDDAQPNDSANSLALSTGGGVEMGISDWLSVRTVEAEFLASHMPNDLSGAQHNFRVSSGLIFRFSSNVLNR